MGISLGQMMGGSPKKVDSGVLGFVGRSYTATILEHRVEVSMEIPEGKGLIL